MWNSIMVWEKGKIVYTKYRESKSLTFHLAREGKENEDRLAITKNILLAKQPEIKSPPRKHFWDLEYWKKTVDRKGLDSRSLLGRG